VFTQRQSPYIRHWMILLAGAEGLMLVLHRQLYWVYASIAVLFACGFFLRIFKLYPGKEEPLGLDASAVVIALLFARAAFFLQFSGWRFTLIFVSSLIIMPHLWYIVKEL